VNTLNDDFNDHKIFIDGIEFQNLKIKIFSINFIISLKTLIHLKIFIHFNSTVKENHSDFISKQKRKHLKGDY
jgi:hypothetical protein